MQPSGTLSRTQSMRKRGRVLQHVGGGRRNPEISAAKPVITERHVCGASANVSSKPRADSSLITRLRASGGGHPRDS
eukprot:scaffold171374_cov28-Tisochrysis_lutea.AAC.1